jgi:hypothetical protein
MEEKECPHFSEQYTMFCKEQFGLLNKKLDAIDASVRGNGGLGLIVRLDRLEQRHKTMKWMVGFLLLAAGAFGAEFLVKVLGG